jgi:hypothetical protein
VQQELLIGPEDMSLSPVSFKQIVLILVFMYTVNEKQRIPESLEES